jgi:transmembrane sensor
MKQYSTFSPGDFALDEDFLKWVKYPGRCPSLDTFWESWLRENSHKREAIEEARHMILAVVEENQYLPDDLKKQELWNRIHHSIAPFPPAEKRIIFWQQWYSKAAVILVVMGIGWFAWNFTVKDNDSPLLAVGKAGEVDYVKQINNADAQKTVILSDGTSIMLQPQSILEYPKRFRPDIRQVHLTGQAFFEVSRDPNRPFLVQAGEIVTRVLGTSFTVRNVEDEDNVIVQVKTGKVSVFMASEMDRPSGNSQKTIEGVVLMPNQQVLYERLEMKMTKSLVENPRVLIPLARQEFEFSDAPIKDVFRAIEQAYGVDIVFDEEALSSCYLNASLTDVPLYDKLKLICKGINTTYEIIDSHIIIYGKGCGEEIPNPKSNP